MGTPPLPRHHPGGGAVSHPASPLLPLSPMGRRKIAKVRQCRSKKVGLRQTITEKRTEC